MTNCTYGVQTADPFGIADADLAATSLEKTQSQNVDVSQDHEGEYVGASAIAFGDTEALRVGYLAQVKTTITGKSVDLGGDAIALESFEISTSKGARTTASASGHRHISGTNTGHSDEGREVALPAFRGFGADDFGLDITVARADLQSATYRVEIEHSDEEDADGGHLCGSSHGEKHTASFEAITCDSFTVPDGWQRTDKTDPAESNSGHRRKRLTIVKYVAKPIGGGGEG